MVSLKFLNMVYAPQKVTCRKYRLTTTASWCSKRLPSHKPTQITILSVITGRGKASQGSGKESNHSLAMCSTFNMPRQTPPPTTIFIDFRGSWTFEFFFSVVFRLQSLIHSFNLHFLPVLPHGLPDGLIRGLLHTQKSAYGGEKNFLLFVLRFPPDHFCYFS